MLLKSLAVIDDREPRSAAMNMAIDEALLLTATAPTFRAYRWKTNAVSFGYFDHYEEVRTTYPDRELVRRWTGGGVVDHTQDFTYSLVIPAERREFSARAIYAEVHAAIALVLGPGAVLAGAAQSRSSGECFENPVADDVLMAGRKVAGAALRRTRQGTLLQGSIQCSIDREIVLTKIIEKLAQEFEKIQMCKNLLLLSGKLSSDRYANEAWQLLR